MITLKRSDSSNKDFVDLVKQLDAYLKVTNGEEHDFYNQYNSIENLKNVVIAYSKNKPVGCGTFKHFENNSVEIKRMFTREAYRGNGIATLILKELEKWATELNHDSCILETGIRQNEAVEFYKKNSYNIIPNYGQYKGVKNSLCFMKNLQNEKRQ